MRFIHAMLILASAALIAATAAAQEYRYVSDELHVSFRTGPGNQYAIQRFLVTGTRLELLEPPGDADFPQEALDEWDHVRDPRGDTGWMQSRYLMTERAARDRLADAQQTLADTRAELGEQRSALDAARRRNEELESRLAEARGEVDRLEHLLGQAEQGYELAQANENLKERVAMLLERNEELEVENRRMSERSQQEWFVVGAGVLGVGLLLGLILPRLGPRRRSTWAGSGL